MNPYTAYVETPAGIWRERDGIIDGPFSRAELGLDPLQMLRGCETLRCSFSAGASLSFGFGYGPRADNTFEASGILNGQN